MVDLIAAGLILATGLLAGFGIGVMWERRRWEDREDAKTMAALRAWHEKAFGSDGVKGSLNG